jgi:pyruvate dehydrogenase E1 component
MYQLTKSKDAKLKVQLLGSGTIFREVIAASEMLRNDWGVESDIWGCPSFTELGRDWNTVSRNNLLNPEGKMQISHVEACLKDTKGPVIAATDYIKMFAEQIRPCHPKRWARDIQFLEQTALEDQIQEKSYAISLKWTESG